MPGNNVKFGLTLPNRGVVIGATTVAEMLRLARRRNVHVVLATQTVGSLPEGVEEAVWTNVSDFVAFRGSPEEARELERATVGVSVEEILALPRGHAAVLLGKGNSVAWMRTAGRPPDANDLDLRPPPPSKSPPSEGVRLASTSEDRKSTRLNSSHTSVSRMPSSA